MAEEKLNMDVMNVEEAAAYLRFSTTYLYRLAREKKIPHVNYGRHIIFRKVDLFNWLGKMVNDEAQAEVQLVNTDIEKAITEAQIFIEQQAEQNKYGDITVTITLNDGVPVKLTKVFCEHLVRRKTVKLVAN